MQFPFGLITSSTHQTKVRSLIIVIILIKYYFFFSEITEICLPEVEISESEFVEIELPPPIKNYIEDEEITSFIDESQDKITFKEIKDLEPIHSFVFQA